MDKGQTSSHGSISLRGMVCLCLFGGKHPHKILFLVDELLKKKKKERINIKGKILPSKLFCKNTKQRVKVCDVNQNVCFFFTLRAKV